jgi:excisionase family DNA binding protein
MDAEVKPLFVRVAATAADRLDRAAEETGQSKRRLVESAVHSYLGDDGLVLGRVSLNEAAPEVLTPAEAAAFLRVEEEVVVRMAEEGEIPARQVGGEWRFSREALLGWLARVDPAGGD